MPSLILMIGNIGSGKSTLVKQLVKQGYIVVSRDALRYMIRGGYYLYDPDLEPEIFAIEQFALNAFISLGYDIVIDETNVNAKGRKKYIAIGKKYKYKITAIVMPQLSKELSISRRLRANHGNTTKETWGKVWDMFNKFYDKPSRKEGFNKIVYYKGDSYGKIKL